MKKILFVSCFAFLFMACEKDHEYECGFNSSSESFAFGTAYGECGGNCANFFLVSDGNLYPDDMQYYTGKFEFLATPMSHQKYLLAKQLFDNFPLYLRNMPNTTFGCPDCHDQGGIHIKLSKNGVDQYWHIDTDVDEQPQEIRDYITQLKSVLVQL